jgi:hypothetical protein
MKTADKKLMQWIDGELTDREGRELKPRENTKEAEIIKQEWEALGTLIREAAPKARGEMDSTFNAQILAQIRTEQRSHGSAPATGRRESSILRLGDLAWLGAACLICAFGILLSVTPKNQSSGVTELTSVRVPDRNISATLIGRDEGVAILWTTGLDFLPDHQFRLTPN